jgi:PAS domain S-box-containing protein
VIARFIDRLKSVSLWHFVWISVIFSEALTAAMSVIITGRIDYGFMVTGAVVPLVVAPVVIHLVIVARKKAEEALREAYGKLDVAKSRLEHLLTSSTAVIYTCKADGDFGATFISENVKDQLGYKPDDFISNSGFWKDGIHPDDVTRILGEVETLFDKGAHVNEYRFLHKDGSYRWMRDELKLIRDKDGNPLEMVGCWYDITERKQAEQQLRTAFDEIKHLKEQLEAENIYLREEVKTIRGHEKIVGESEAIRETMINAERVAGADSTVLMQGETGTGKELLARAIHDMSSRKNRAFIAVNCAAIPTTLLESELFGREKGAYTGALSRQTGRFEVADCSTIFLDEVAELPLEAQAKLLRVLQEGKFERLGSTSTVKVDVRVIAATNRDIKRAVQSGRFRDDLFYRLNVFPITVPPLRERREDIPSLVWFFVKEFSERMGKQIERISLKTMDELQAYPWPGNIRELKNIIERSIILTKGTALKVELPSMTSAVSSNGLTLDEVQREHITSVLDQTGWRVRGKNGAAEILGLKPSTLESRMTRLGIKRKS